MKKYLIFVTFFVSLIGFTVLTAAEEVPNRQINDFLKVELRNDGFNRLICSQRFRVFQSA